MPSWFWVDRIGSYCFGPVKLDDRQTDRQTLFLPGALYFVNTSCLNYKFTHILTDLSKLCNIFIYFISCKFTLSQGNVKSMNPYLICQKFASQLAYLPVHCCRHHLNLQVSHHIIIQHAGEL